MTPTFCLSDLFVSVWPFIFALDLSRYLIAAGVLAAILFVFSKSLANRRIQSTLASGRDVRREIAYSIVTAVFFSLVGFCVYAGGQLGFFRIYSGELPGASRIFLELLAIVLLHDTYFYWLHRAMHTRWLFKWVHRTHHKSRAPTPWAAYAFAPVEAILEAGILPLGALFIPMHEVTVFLFVTHMVLRNVVGHAGVELFPKWWLKVPLLRTVTTTIHHDLHHSHGADTVSRGVYNYGLYFRWWDRLMNTEHPDYETRFESVTGKSVAMKEHVVPDAKTRGA